MGYLSKVPSLPSRANDSTCVLHRISEAVLRLGKPDATVEVPSGEQMAQRQTSHGDLMLKRRSPNDEALLELEVRFNAISASLMAAQRSRYDRGKLNAEQVAENSDLTDIESALAVRLPIELAIMQSPACTIVGLGVKARHAAYVMSQYWEAPIDRLDWDAQALRLLIEAVCDVAGTPLPIKTQAPAC